MVATPAYLAARGHPETPDALIDHRCIGLRLPSSDTLYVWCFLHRGKETRVRTTGPVIFNTLEMMHRAAGDGLGLAMLPRDVVADDLAAGRLHKVLSKEAPPLPGDHLFYPNRRHASPAFRLLVDALRYRGRVRPVDRHEGAGHAMPGA